MATAPPVPGAPLPRVDVEALLGFPLSDEQWECVSAPLEPFVIVAGAGTGKTTVMAARVLWLVASGIVADHQVLGLTFTNKAAGELAHRMTTLLNRWRESRPPDPEHAGEATIATYHSFARRLIDEQGLRVGIEPGARLLTTAAVAQLAHRAVCDAHGLVASTGEPAALAGAVLRLDANLAEQTISTDELRAHDEAAIAEIDAVPARPTVRLRRIRESAERRIELAGLVDTVRAGKARVGGLGFEDHMRLCVDLVRSGDELGRVMRAAFRIILLDEYQDTSIAQRVILSTLFRGAAVTAVGDPMQAIYGWRSASVANIESFASHFGRDGRAPVRVLSVNRRSGEPILAAANHIACALRVDHPQIATLRPPQPRDATIRAALLATVAEEREWIAARVAGLVASGTPPESIGVLVRANDDLWPLREALAAHGVRGAVCGSAALTASPFAVAVLATLRLLADPADNTSAVALLAGPRWRIGPRELALLGRRARHRVRVGGEPAAGSMDQQLAAAVARVDPVRRPSLLEAATHAGPEFPADVRRRLAEFSAELRLLQEHVGEPLADLAALVVRVTGAAVEAELTSPGGGADPGLAGLQQLVDQFADAEGRTGLGAFVAHLDAGERFGAAEVVDLPIVPDAVQLMTIHKAKGLEWPVVVLPHLCRGVFPGGRGSERWTTIPHVVPAELRDDRHVLPSLAGWRSKDLDAFEEACRGHDRSGDDRLAYVAVTRARDVLIASGHWWGPTQVTPRGPSDYLLALHGARTDEGDPWAEDPREGDDPLVPPANPMLDDRVDVPWPVAADSRVVARAAAVAALSGLVAGPHPGGGHPWEQQADLAGLTDEGAAQVSRVVASWDGGIAALLARGAAGTDGRITVPLPTVLSASSAMGLVADPDRFAVDLARPMPRRRNRYAELGTAFHAWVEARLGLQPLITDDDLPGAADAGVESPEDLAALKESFERLPYARRAPAGLEVPFTLALGGRVIRGRMDAVFPAEPGAGEGVLWEVVDWKTSSQDEADPLQLAIYRLAWADIAGVAPEQVRASFVFVRSGRVVQPDELPDAWQLEVLINRAPGFDPGGPALRSLPDEALFVAELAAAPDGRAEGRPTGPVARRPRSARSPATRSGEQDTLW